MDFLTSGMGGLDIQLESGSRLGRLTYGLDYYEDHADSARRDYNADGSLRTVRIQGPVGDDVVYGMFGLFVQDEIAASGRLNMLLGARFNHVRADIGRYADPLTNTPAAMTDEWQNVIGSIRVVNLNAGWHATDRLSLYGGLENLLDEAYRSHGSGGNEPGFGAVLGMDLRF